MVSRFAILASVFGIAALSGAGLARAADPVSDADKAFVAKVSQGGMYEVQLGKLAETKGVTQDIKDQGTTETHDHTLVGDKLKSIAQSAAMEFPDKLNPEFQARLDTMNALPADKFDTAYLDDMKKIHAADGAAFATEAKSGTNPALKSFAAETHRIVERHIGALSVTVH